jgi:hypothetical protein
MSHETNNNNDTNTNITVNQGELSLAAVAFSFAKHVEEISNDTQKKLNAVTNKSKSLTQCLTKLDNVLSALLPLLKNMTETKDWHYDLRGGWDIFFTLLNGCLVDIKKGLDRIPNIQKKETLDAKVFRVLWSAPRAIGYIKEFIEELEILTQVLPVLILVSSGQSLTESEAEKLAPSLYTYPFWYRVRRNQSLSLFLSSLFVGSLTNSIQFDPGTRRIKEVLNFLKITVAKTYTKQGIQRHISFAQNGINTLFNRSTKFVRI